MTNTLHRYGNAESFHDDYVVFAMASKGKNDDDCVPKLKRFLEMALPFKPVNLGDAIHALGNLGNRVKLPLALNVEEIDAVVECHANLGIGLARAGEDDLVGGAARFQGAIELAAAGDVAAGPAFDHEPGDVQIAVGLDRVAD